MQRIVPGERTAMRALDDSTLAKDIASRRHSYLVEFDPMLGKNTGVNELSAAVFATIRSCRAQ